jgi:hypothetical protein
MARMILTPWTGSISVEGRISYNESAQAWNILRLPKEIMNDFPVLKKKRAKLSFRMEHVRNIENLKARVKKIEEEKKPIPILLYLYLEEPL